MSAHIAATQRYRGQTAATLLAGLRTAAWGDGEAMEKLIAALTGKAAPADDQTSSALAAFGIDPGSLQ